MAVGFGKGLEAAGQLQAPTALEWRVVEGWVAGGGAQKVPDEASVGDSSRAAPRRSGDGDTKTKCSETNSTVCCTMLKRPLGFL